MPRPTFRPCPMAKQMGADVTLDFRKVDVVEEILKLTGGRGAGRS
ncbi:hypothetical protein ACT3UM_09505 [Halomonas sp. AOP13-D3-9]